jgi:hypothetical protein
VCGLVAAGGDSESDQLPEWVPPGKFGLALLALALEAPQLPPAARAAAPAVAVLPAFLDLLQDQAARAWQRVRTFTDSAVHAYGGDAEALLERLAEDERLLWMLDAGLDAAVRASTERKARVLGRALTSGALAADDAQVDERAQMLRILADLETAEVRLLSGLANLEDHPAATHIQGPGWQITTDKLHMLTGGMSNVATQAAIAVLQRHGLVTSFSTFGPTMWVISQVGQAVLNFIEDEGKTAWT